MMVSEKKKERASGGQFSTSSCQSTSMTGTRDILFI
jgi:hypothetical protein